MNLFNKIRDYFGLSTSVKQVDAIDQIDQLSKEQSEVEQQLTKAQEEFDAIDNELSLKIKACDKLIEKGVVKEGEFNKSVISNKLERISDDYIATAQELTAKLNDITQRRVALEADIIAKSIDLVAYLSEEEQQSIKDIMDTWNETGLIKGELVEQQVKAINRAIEIVTIEEEDIQKSHEPIAVENAGKGDVEYDNTPVEGHYANAIVQKYDTIDGKSVCKTLFLKRAIDKEIAPGQYCLPGGHIDAGETIEQAALRELFEEANLKASNAYISGKAKCDDGKWAFYARVYVNNPAELALLDGENENACWMSEDEWLEADLFFDLKDHLVAMEVRSENIATIPDILKKAEEIDEIEKSSFVSKEGSKGGRIIGHTKSGKPVYARLTADHPEYKNFSSRDHEDAAKFHGEARTHGEGNTYGTTGSTSYFWHNKRKGEHEARAKGSTVNKSEDNPFEAEDGSFFFEG